MDVGDKPNVKDIPLVFDLCLVCQKINLSFKSYKIKKRFDAFITFAVFLYLVSGVLRFTQPRSRLEVTITTKQREKGERARKEAWSCGDQSGRSHGPERRTATQTTVERTPSPPPPSPTPHPARNPIASSSSSSSSQMNNLSFSQRAVFCGCIFGVE